MEGCDINRLRKRIPENKGSFRFDHARENRKLQDKKGELLVKKKKKMLVFRVILWVMTVFFLLGACYMARHRNARR